MTFTVARNRPLGLINSHLVSQGDRIYKINVQAGGYSFDQNQLQGGISYVHCKLLVCQIPIALFDISNPVIKR
jgi:hypothetical protein